MKDKRGFTLIELLTVMAIIALLVGMLLPALGQGRNKALLLRDQVQIKEIHQSWVAFARQYEGRYPTPGLINCLPDPLFANHDKMGRGPEDIQANTSAFMYSAGIMANYFTPQILVGPTEPSGFVAVKDDFDWSVYDPIGDIYWDSDENGNVPSGSNVPGYEPFAVRLDKENHAIGSLLCNTSYSHTPIVGDRKINEWRDTANADWAIIGNRGVRNGNDEDPAVYNASITLQIHGGSREWWGNICFNDNHLELLRTFYPKGVSYLETTGGSETTTRPDNIFRNDVQNGDLTSGEGHDVWLTLVSKIQDPLGLQIVTEWD